MRVEDVYSLQRVGLIGPPCELQVAEGDEATSQVLQRQVARSFGADAVDLLLRYQARDPRAVT